MNRDAMNPYTRHSDDLPESTVDITPAVDTPGVDTPDVDLGQDPFDDGLSERLASAAPRRWRTRTTVVLTSMLILVGGFVGGLEVQKHWGAGTSTAAGTNGAGFSLPGGGYNLPGAGFTPGAGQGASAAPASGTTTGTVKLVDGDTVYITTSDGRTITVKTSGSTTVQTAAGGSLSDLTSGSTVTVQGQTGSDGSISASTITKAK
jgi:hypothetical protein